MGRGAAGVLLVCYLVLSIAGASAGVSSHRKLQKRALLQELSVTTPDQDEPNALPQDKEESDDLPQATSSVPDFRSEVVLGAGMPAEQTPDGDWVDNEWGGDDISEAFGDDADSPLAQGPAELAQSAELAVAQGPAMSAKFPTESARLQGPAMSAPSPAEFALSPGPATSALAPTRLATAPTLSPISNPTTSTSVAESPLVMKATEHPTATPVMTTEVPPKSTPDVMRGPVTTVPSKSQGATTEAPVKVQQAVDLEDRTSEDAEGRLALHYSSLSGKGSRVLWALLGIACAGVVVGTVYVVWRVKGKRGKGSKYAPAQEMEVMMQTLQEEEETEEI